MEIMTTLADVFGEYGIETLRVTLSLGEDDREGMLDCDATHRHAHTDAIDELAVWMRWLRETGRDSVVLLGHSRATNQVTRYAVRPDLPVPAALVLVAPGVWDAAAVASRYGSQGGPALGSLLAHAAARVEAGRGGEVLGRVPFLHCAEAQVTAAAFLSYYADEPEFDTLGLAAGAGLPVLVFVGSEDPLTDGVEEAVAALPVSAPIEFVRIDGADHFFRDLYAYDLVEAVVASLEDGTGP
jgi:pimeloyl-ACP methyl ester carboxylesterase